MAGKPLCLLALDGGGIRGLSELLILEQIMSRIKYDLKMTDDPLPADFFDLIGGTSTGGLIALLLGRVRLSVPQARREYVRIAQDVFSIERFKTKSKFDCKKLEKAVKQLLQDKLGHGRDEERMLDPVESACKVFVCAVPQQDVRTRAGPRLFRTYDVREYATFNCTIWEASRATSAAPAYFDPISIGDPGEEETFVDGGLGYNNPIEQVLEEACRIFPKRKVACIVSIGTGLARVIRFPSSPKTSPFKLVDALTKMATESDTTAERVQVRFRETQDTYFRFSVDRGLDNIDLAEWKNLPDVRTYTTGSISKKRVWSVPFEKNPSFTGRESELKELRAALFTKEQTAKVGITGLGGIGKTQLALAMAYEIRDEYEDCCVLWLPSTSRDSIEKAYLNAAQKLGIPGAEDDKADVKALVRDYLSKERAGRWLLVFDNADDISIWIDESAGESGRLKDYLPTSPGRGSIIFTTRDKKAAAKLID
ncbi:hypothetical protein SEUCBS140593_010533 [Sporothrix eucalyptigena]|uniref:PNPLA domain-containing protein n=1 Tax=Sporothrix eucalyptigena TaxID=1812306 RepID=A0ABP0D377_9PEZI